MREALEKSARQPKGMADYNIKTGHGIVQVRAPPPSPPRGALRVAPPFLSYLHTPCQHHGTNTRQGHERERPPPSPPPLLSPTLHPPRPDLHRSPSPAFPLPLQAEAAYNYLATRCGKAKKVL